MSSYDYDQIVSDIIVCRRNVFEIEQQQQKDGDEKDGDNGDGDGDGEAMIIDQLTKCIDLFESLSGYCPMTPLLWMHYAYDTSKLLQLVSSSSSMDEEDEKEEAEDETRKEQEQDPHNQNQNQQEVLQTRLQLLELGIHEFPGCAVLRLQYCELMLVSVLLVRAIHTPNSNPIVSMKSHIEKYKSSLDEALHRVGKGSHRNESPVIVALYQLRVDAELRFYDTNNTDSVLSWKENSRHHQDVLVQLFRQRSETPMNENRNASLNEEYNQIVTTMKQHQQIIVDNNNNNNTHTSSDSDHDDTMLLSLSSSSFIEGGRRFEAKHYGFLITYEDDIEIILQTECGVSIREGIQKVVVAAASTSTSTDTNTDTNTNTNHVTYQNNVNNEIKYLLQKWDVILNNNNNNNNNVDGITSTTTNNWMGLGGPQTAQVFINYAQACFRFRFRSSADDDEEEREQSLQEKIQALAISVYERGISECPTIEALWVSYLRRLIYIIEQTQRQLEEFQNDDEELIRANEALRNHQQQLTTDLHQHLTAASNVVDRALRNCPYSIPLIQLKFQILLEQVNARLVILDPEEIYQTLVLKQLLMCGDVPPDTAATATIDTATTNSDSGRSLEETIQIVQCLIDLIRKRILYLLAELVHNDNTIQEKRKKMNEKETEKETTNDKQKKKKKKKKKTVPESATGGVLRLKYDDSESMQGLLTTPNNNGGIIGVTDDDDDTTNDILQEIEDLCSDIRDIYEEADTYLRTTFNKKLKRPLIDEGRVVLGKDRSRTESYLVAPVLSAIQQQQQHNKNPSQQQQERERKETFMEVVKQNDKVTKISQPPHPSTYRSYIQLLVSSTTMTSAATIIDIMINLRRVRFLYQKALKCVGTSNRKGGSNQKDTATTTNHHHHDELDYETSLRCLCHEYTTFEKYFGSHRSYTECLKVTNKKLIKIASSITAITASSVASSFPAVAAIVQDQNQDQNQVTSAAFRASSTPTVIASATTPAPTPASTPAKNTGAADADADVLVATTGSQEDKKRKVLDADADADADVVRGDGDGDDRVNRKEEQIEPPPPTKKQKVTEEQEEQEPENDGTALSVSAKSNNGTDGIETASLHQDQQPKPKQPLLISRKHYKIKIGKLEYPAHPYTVKVSCLDPTTTDMDLVTVLRPKCGQIVHAKIMREKKHKKEYKKKSSHTNTTVVDGTTTSHKSKGWGLVQFEERASVDKALQLSNIIGIKMKCIKIERSHLPAVSLVPPQQQPQPPRPAAATATKTSSSLSRGSDGGKQQQQQQQQLKGRHKQQQHQKGKQLQSKDTDNRDRDKDTTEREQGGQDELVGVNKKKKPRNKNQSSSSSSTLAFLPRGVHKK